MPKFATTAMLLGAIAVATAGCGVRGGLEFPQEARQEAQAAATADAGQGKPEGGAGKPHNGFILDGLIQ